MIDLGATHEEMLAAIWAGAASPSETLTDPLALAFSTAKQVRLDLVGHARDDLFPTLKIALTARFALVPPSRLTLDLLGPLKNALGNAYKRGNAGDRAKSIAVALDATPRGGVLRITDEGDGFDARRTLERFRSREQYFENSGAGFRIFDRAGSIVSYADGGRTLLLCFRVDEGAEPPGEGSTQHAVPRPLTGATTATPLDIGLENRVRAALAKARVGLVTRSHGRKPMLTVDGAALVIDSLHLIGPTAHDAAVRCAVRCRLDGHLVTAVLTGRRFDSPAAARADFDMARTLRKSIASKKVRIPEPIACLDADRLVFSAFDPWMNLWTYVEQREEDGSLQRLAGRLGTFLGALHHRNAASDSASGRTDVEDWPAVVEEWKRSGERAARIVAAEHPKRGNDVQGWADATVQAATRLSPVRAVWTHGAFGADAIHYGVDGRFYLWGYDACRRSHPGLDVGTALADLYLLARSRAFSSSDPADDVVHDEFMQAYADDERPEWYGEVPHFVLAALLRRLADSSAGAHFETDVVLDLCERMCSEAP